MATSNSITNMVQYIAVQATARNDFYQEHRLAEQQGFYHPSIIPQATQYLPAYVNPQDLYQSNTYPGATARVLQPYTTDVGSPGAGTGSPVNGEC